MDPDDPGRTRYFPLRLFPSRPGSCDRRTNTAAIGTGGSSPTDRASVVHLPPGTLGSEARLHAARSAIAEPELNGEAEDLSYGVGGPSLRRLSGGVETRRQERGQLLLGVEHPPLDRSDGDVVSGGDLMIFPLLDEAERHH